MNERIARDHARARVVIPKHHADYLLKRNRQAKTAEDVQEVPKRSESCPLPPSIANASVAKLVKQMNNDSTVSPYADAPSTFLFPKVDKGGLVEQVRNKQREKHEIDKEMRIWREKEDQIQNSKRECAVNERREQERQLLEKQKRDKLQAKEEQNRERAQIDMQLVNIARLDDDRKRHVYEKRQQQKEQWKEEVLQRALENTSTQSNQKQREAKVRQLSTKATIKDLIDEHEFLKSKKASEMALRREELHQKEADFARRKEQQRQDQLVERLICEHAIEQARNTDLQNRAMSLLEGERRKHEVRQKQTEKLRHNADEKSVVSEDVWHKRTPTPPIRRGKFCPPSFAQFQPTIC